MNPSLAVTMQLELLKFPLICTPKIDGVRGWAPHGSILCRSMEPPANLHTRKLFNNPLLIGCDGELCVGDPWNDSACRNTTSALNSIGGTPNVIWHLFDYVTRETFFQTYANRLDRLQDFLYSIQGEEFSSRLMYVPHEWAHSLEELLEIEKRYVAAGYEGLVARSPDSLWRSGRASITSQSYLRLKRFEDREGEIVRLIEGTTNNNSLSYGTNGYAKRSTHAENMLPSGKVGSLVVRDFQSNKLVTVSKGKLTATECERYWGNPELIVGSIATYRIFPRGSVNLPRHPTLQNIRARFDMGKES